MTDALRHALGFLPWLVAAGLLGTEAWSRLLARSKRDRARVALSYGAVAAACGGAALAAAVYAAKQVPVIQAEALAQSGVLDMDLDRTVAVLRWWGHGYYRTSVHPLVCLLFQPPAAFVSKLSGLGDFRTAQLVAGLCLASSAALLGVTVLRATRRPASALLTAALYVASFSFLLHAGLPESASLAAPTVALPALLLALFRDREPTRRETALWVVAGVLALGVTVTNVAVPLIFHAIRARQGDAAWRSLLRRVATNVGLVVGTGVVLSLAQFALYPGSALWFLPTAVLEEGSFVRVDFGIARIGSTVLQIAGYTLVGPRFIATDTLARRGLVSPYISAQAFPPAALPALAIALLVIAIAWLAWATYAGRADRLVQAALAGVGFNVLLHLVYGNEFLLYSANWGVLLVLALGLSIAKLRRPFQVASLALVGVLGINNAGALSQLHAMTREHGERAALHMPLGAPGSHEFSRSYVAWNGSYSPGIGTCGVHLAVFDPSTAETNWDGLVRGSSDSTYALRDGWIPETLIGSKAGAFRVEQATSADVRGVYTRLRISSASRGGQAKARVLALVTGSGAAGSGAARRYARAPGANEITADGQPVLMFGREPDRVDTVLEERGIPILMSGGGAPPSGGLISGLRDRIRRLLGRSDAAKPTAVLASWEIDVPADRPAELWFVSPLAMAPRIGRGQDVASAKGLPPYEPAGKGTTAAGISSAPADAAGIAASWTSRFDSLTLQLPDSDWADAMRASAAQLALALQTDGRLPVTPVNYGPFTRDAAYMVHGLVVTGQWAAAREALDFLFANPWSGRPYPEGDTPGQLLWAAGTYVEFSHDVAWLQKRAPDIRNLALAVEAMRSVGAAAVDVDVLGQRRRIEPSPAAQALRRRVKSAELPRLNYGSMDGGGLLYVNLISITGLEAAVNLLRTAGDPSAAESALTSRNGLAVELGAVLNAVGYDFAWDGRGECAALWPAHFDRLDSGATEYFRRPLAPGQDRPGAPWPYLELDAAHNRLFAGVRDAGSQAVRRYLDNANFRRWRVLDEGGGSDPGYWPMLATNPPWNAREATPHGWSLASLLLLMRDCLVHEDRGQLRLLAGVPDDWFAAGKSWRIGLPTAYGPIDLQVDTGADDVRVEAGDGCRPPAGFALQLPEGFEATELHADAGPFRFTIKRSTR